MNSKSYALSQAARDNVRNHNIGISDGFTPEQASDLGFETFDQVVGLIQKQELSTRQQATAPKIGSVPCGDCTQVIPCGHAGIDRNGKGFTKGH